VLQTLALEPLAHYRPVWSEWIIAETWRVLVRRRVEMAERSGSVVDWELVHTQSNQMMVHLLEVMAMRSLAGRPPLPTAWAELSDPDDVPIWETALLAGAQFVVSHDIRHFPPLQGEKHVYLGVEYLTTIEFVEDELGLDLEATYGRPIPSKSLIRSRRRP
jgi:hypothetical protein